jgi:hypothetical protein
MATFKGVVLSCEICGSVFKVPQCRKATARFCSRKCAGIHGGLEKELPRVELVCKNCGITFLERQCHARRRSYCSNECRFSGKEYLEALSERSSGSGNAMWAGGTSMHSDGYVYEKCVDHPYASNGYVFQHRLVVERCVREKFPASKCLIELGGQLYLSPAYVVHHKDGDRCNNELSNLQILTNSDHIKLHNARRRALKEKRI